jgi:hypothetical protein
MWEMEDTVDRKLEHELEVISSHEADLNTREATLETSQKSLEETRTEILGCELTADIRDACLNSREEELADMEKRLAEREK